MLKRLEIPVYGPMIRPRDNAQFGTPEANFNHAQMNSMMRFEGEIADPNYIGGKYVGERDMNGFRQGYGTFTFGDGSYYRGQWWQGLRHGYGELRMMNLLTGQEIALYQGQWAYDLKHGFGKFTLPNVKIITGVWLHDRLNGRAMVREPAHANPKEVVFKDDLSIQFTIGGI